MSAMASQIIGLSIVYSTVRAQIKENIEAPRHWPLWGESIADLWIPLQRVIENERYNVDIPWRI